MVNKVCSCFVASGPGRLVVINRTLNFALYPKILKEYLAISFWPEAQAELGYATNIGTTPVSPPQNS